MPHTSSTVRSLAREQHAEFVVGPDEPVEDALCRIDRAELEAVCRHLVGRPPVGPRPVSTSPVSTRAAVTRPAGSGRVTA